jgi:DNA-binding NarL/FixJ family response regulator
MISTIGDCEIIGKICDPTDVIPFLEENLVDLIISDISMPKMDGLALAAQVKKKFPAVRMLMLTVSEAPEQVHRAHALGIEGYVLKKTNKEELTNAIRQIMSGESFYAQSIAAYV